MDWGEGRIRLLAQVAAATVSLALLFPMGEARAAHVSCGQVITTDTVLDADLDCRFSPRFEIGASGIRLDLNGHLLDGRLRNLGFDDVTIAGGTIGGEIRLDGVHRNTVTQIVLGEGFSDSDGSGSVFASASDDNEFAGVSGETPYALFQLIGSNRNTVSDGSRLSLNTGGDANRFTGMRDSFIDLGGSHNVVTQWESGGVDVLGSENQIVGNRLSEVVFVQGNTNRIAENAFSTDGVAISVVRASSNVIENNRIDALSTATNSAMFLFAADSTVITGNVISGRSDLGEEPSRPAGMWIQGGSGNMVARNTISGRADGVQLSGTVENTVTGNIVNDAGGSGIYLYHADRNAISHNEVSLGGNGITLALSSDQNQILRNRSTRNAVDGVAVQPARGTGNLLSDNAVRLNGDDGIDVDVAGNTVSGNNARRNFDWGIEAVAGTIDGGGNRARRNGQPAQCLNIACTR